MYSIIFNSFTSAGSVCESLVLLMYCCHCVFFCLFWYQLSASAILIIIYFKHHSWQRYREISSEKNKICIFQGSICLKVSINFLSFWALPISI